MNPDKLSSAFWEIRKNDETPNYQYIQKICDQIIKSNLTAEKVDQILYDCNILPSTAKNYLLNLILQYIEISLQDGVLTFDEKRNINLLKSWFRIHEGDFHRLKQNEIQKIISNQLEIIYNDKKVSDEEELFILDLEDIFDLGIDQFNAYKEEALRSMNYSANEDRSNTISSNEILIRDKNLTRNLYSYDEQADSVKMSWWAKAFNTLNTSLADLSKFTKAIIEIMLVGAAILLSYFAHDLISAFTSNILIIWGFTGFCFLYLLSKFLKHFR